MSVHEQQKLEHGDCQCAGQGLANAALCISHLYLSGMHSNSNCYIFIYFQGYFGCAVGKAKQAAKTEIEKLKLADMTCKELVKEAARM